MSDQRCWSLLYVVSSGNDGGGDSKAKLVVNDNGEDRCNTVLIQPWSHNWEAVVVVFCAPCQSGGGEWKLQCLAQRMGGVLGWEFRFSVPIFGTPIVSGIPIPFSIPKTPFGKYFLNSDVWRVRKSEFRFQNSEFRYLIRKQILIPA
jgi:hypothetical protein